MKSVGIIILFAFSIPSEIPITIMAKLATIAIIIHIFAPKADAVWPKVPPIASMSWPSL